MDVDSYLIERRQEQHRKSQHDAQQKTNAHGLTEGYVKSQQREIETFNAEYMETAKYQQKDAWLAKRIGSELVRKYPGHGWNVIADSKQGIVKIYNQMMSGMYGYIWRMAEISTDDGVFRKQVMLIGGEMLRRFSISGDRLDDTEILELQSKRDFAGRVKVDLS